MKHKDAEARDQTKTKENPNNGIKTARFTSVNSYLQARSATLTLYMMQIVSRRMAQCHYLLVTVDQQPSLHVINQTTKKLVSIFLLITLHVSSNG